MRRTGWLVVLLCGAVGAGLLFVAVEALWSDPVAAHRRGTRCCEPRCRRPPRRARGPAGSVAVGRPGPRRCQPHCGRPSRRTRGPRQAVHGGGRRSGGGPGRLRRAGGERHCGRRHDRGRAGAQSGRAAIGRHRRWGAAAVFRRAVGPADLARRARDRTAGRGCQHVPRPGRPADLLRRRGGRRPLGRRARHAEAAVPGASALGPAAAGPAVPPGDRFGREGLHRVAAAGRPADRRHGGAAEAGAAGARLFLPRRPGAAGKPDPAQPGLRRRSPLHPGRRRRALLSRPDRRRRRRRGPGRARQCRPAGGDRPGGLPGGRTPARLRPLPRLAGLRHGSAERRGIGVGQILGMLEH